MASAQDPDNFPFDILTGMRLNSDPLPPGNGVSRSAPGCLPCELSPRRENSTSPKHLFSGVQTPSNAPTGGVGYGSQTNSPSSGQCQKSSGIAMRQPSLIARNPSGWPAVSQTNRKHDGRNSSGLSQAFFSTLFCQGDGSGPFPPKRRMGDLDHKNSTREQEGK